MVRVRPVPRGFGFWVGSLAGLRAPVPGARAAALGRSLGTVCDVPGYLAGPQHNGYTHKQTAMCTPVG